MIIILDQYDFDPLSKRNCENKCVEEKNFISHVCDNPQQCSLWDLQSASNKIKGENYNPSSLIAMIEENSHEEQSTTRDTLVDIDSESNHASDHIEHQNFKTSKNQNNSKMKTISNYLPSTLLAMIDDLNIKSSGDTDYKLNQPNDIEEREKNVRSINDSMDQIHNASDILKTLEEVQIGISSPNHEPCYEKDWDYDKISTIISEPSVKPKITETKDYTLQEVMSMLDSYIIKADSMDKNLNTELKSMEGAKLPNSPVTTDFLKTVNSKNITSTKDAATNTDPSDFSYKITKNPPSSYPKQKWNMTDGEMVEKGNILNSQQTQDKKSLSSTYPKQEWSLQTLGQSTVTKSPGKVARKAKRRIESKFTEIPVTPVLVKLSDKNLTVQGDWIPHMRNFKRRVSEDNNSSDTSSPSDSLTGISEVA